MKFRFHIRGSFYLYWAAAIIFIPISWLFAWACAVFVHELSHFIALKLLGVQVFQITVCANGVIMETEDENNVKMFICALAGPAGGLSLLLLLHIAPRVALCSFFLSAYNLLPIYPLDGGRAVRSLVEYFFTPHTAQRIVCGIEYSSIVAILGLSIFASVYYELGLLPVLCSVWLIFGNKKYLANISNKRYNILNRIIRGTKNDTEATTNFADCSKACPLYRR